MILNAEEMNTLGALRVSVRAKARNKPLMDYDSSDSDGNLQFDDYQPYQPGGSIRHIDWNRYVTESRLVVRKYQRHERPEITIVPDLSASVVAGGKSYAIKRMAAALGFCLLNSGLAVNVHACGMSSRKHIGKNSISSLLHDIDILCEGSYKSLQVNALAAGICQNMIIVSDFIFSDGIDQLKRSLILGDNSCTMLCLANESDRNPAMAGNIKLYDSQNGKTVTTMIDEKILAKYREFRTEYFSQLQGHCKKMGWVFKEIDTSYGLGTQMAKLASNSVLSI